MVFEGDSLKGYRIDSFNDKVIKIDLPNVEKSRINTMKITVEDILNLYDPCRDHSCLLCRSEDCDDLHHYVGYELQQSKFIHCEVDSIGVRDGFLAIWPTDESLKEIAKNNSKENFKPNAEQLLYILRLAKGNKQMQAIILESYVQQFGPLPNELGDKVKELLKDGTCEEMS